jgi:hypothetical protein
LIGGSVELGGSCTGACAGGGKSSGFGFGAGGSASGSGVECVRQELFAFTPRSAAL